MKRITHLSTTVDSDGNSQRRFETWHEADYYKLIYLEIRIRSELRKFQHLKVLIQLSFVTLYCLL